MEKIELYTRINSLQDYYKNKGLTIIGLNDSQGVNTTPTFFKKGLLEYLAAALKSKDLNPTVINAFSLLMNKTEHIDYFLKNNLSLEEIKLSQVYSAVSALEKVMTDIGLPKRLGKVAYAYKLIYQVKEEDKDIRIASQLQQCEEPTLIYSSGVNNLMREVANNPFAIKSDYKKRFENPNFDYTLEKSKDSNTLIQVFDGIKRNIENILRINENTDIYTLGAYVPKSLQIEEMNIFKELIIKYNEELENLCKEYGMSFVDTEKIGNAYNKSTSNFHISTSGHNALAYHILTEMHNRKILTPDNHKPIIEGDFEITGKGAVGMMDDLFMDFVNSRNIADSLSGYEQTVCKKIAREHIREANTFRRVKTKLNS